MNEEHHIAMILHSVYRKNRRNSLQRGVTISCTGMREINICPERNMY